MNKPLVTLSIPTYNRPKEIEKAILSAVNQTYKNLEILIADNCSPNEDVTKICLKYQASDSRIKYHRHEKNMGPLYNYNYLLEQAKGKYHIYLADDDWLSETYIEQSVDFLENHNDYSIVFGDMIFYDTDYKFVRRCPQVDFNENAYEERIAKYCLTGIMSLLSYGLTRTDFVKTTLENCTPRLPEDWILMIKILFHGKGHYINTISYNVLNNGASRSIEGLRKHFNLPHLTHDNFWNLMSENIVDSIIFDQFYQDKLSKKEKISLALCANNALMQNTIKLPIIKRIINKLKRMYNGF